MSKGVIMLYISGAEASEESEKFYSGLEIESKVGNLY
jgi:hypothetical protein